MWRGRHKHQVDGLFLRQCTASSAESNLLNSLFEQLFPINAASIIFHRQDNPSLFVTGCQRDRAALRFTSGKTLLWRSRSVVGRITDEMDEMIIDFINQRRSISVSSPWTIH
jgi:hypothetical protein